MAVSKRIRFEIFKRDLFTCRYCGKRPPEVVLHCDHVIPRVEGGSDDPVNLVTSCESCNLGKGGVSLGNIAPAVDELQLLADMQEMAERKSHLRGSLVLAKAKREADEAAIDTVESWWRDAFGNSEHTERRSISRFLRDLTPAQILDCLHSTELLLQRKPWTHGYALWKYFCGACWHEIKGDNGR